MNPHTALKRLLLLFWSLYFVFVTGSNLVDAFQQLGWVSQAWSYTSGNFALIADTVSEYGMPKGVAALLFGLVILLELSAALLFPAALRDSWKEVNNNSANGIRAFVTAIGLFTGFIVADELFVVYHRLSGLETTHFLVLCALLLSVVVVDGKSLIENR